MTNLICIQDVIGDIYINRISLHFTRTILQYVLTFHSSLMHFINCITACLGADTKIILAKVFTRSHSEFCWILFLSPQCRLCRVGVRSNSDKPHFQSPLRAWPVFVSNSPRVYCVHYKTLCGEHKLFGSMYHLQGKNASRREALGSRNLMEQFTGVRAKVDMYFGKVRVTLV